MKNNSVSQCDKINDLVKALNKIDHEKGVAKTNFPLHQNTN